MGGFDFEGDADDDSDRSADDGVSMDAGDADTVVSPAEPSPLDGSGSLGSTDPDASGGAGGADGADGGTDDGVDAGPATNSTTTSGTGGATTHATSSATASGTAAATAANSEPVEPHLYAGEEVRASLPTADGSLVATSHRVLAYAPENDERATLRGVNRINVTDVSSSSTATDWLVRPIAYAVVGGLAMVLGGSMVSLDSMSASAPEGAGAAGLGGLLSMVGSLLSVLSLVDDVLRVVGALALLVGAALMGVYAATRGREVVVETEGDADTLRMDGGGVDDEAIEHFRAEAGLQNDQSSGALAGLLGR